MKDNIITPVNYKQLEEMLSNPVLPKRYSILLVSDYFFPNLGGVEMHMY